VKNVNMGEYIKIGPTFFTCTFVDCKLSAHHCVGIAIVGTLNFMGEKIQLRWRESANKLLRTRFDFKEEEIAESWKNWRH
jgi:hypothetical protein